MGKKNKNKKRSRITIQNCQIKSIEKARLLCKAIDILEKEVGVGAVEIRLKNNFICPDINLNDLYYSPDPTEHLIGWLLMNIDFRMYGEESEYFQTVVRGRFKNALSDVPFSEINNPPQKAHKVSPRPFSDLRCDINGIIPAVEIAKLAWDVEKSEHEKFSPFEILTTSDNEYIFLKSEITIGKSSVRWAVVYIRNDFRVTCYLDTSNSNRMMQDTNNQVEIFGLLQRLKFIN